MIYRIVVTLIKIFLHIRFKIKITGKENIPNGATILAINHISNFDPPMVGVHTPRKMYIMGKEELFKNKLFGKLLTELGCFPVKRGKADLKSLRQALNVLKEDKIFAIFIEGTRSQSGEMQEVKKGIGFIASKSKAPVVPTYVYGLKNGWFKQAGVIFGKQITFEDGLDNEEIANRIAEEIKKLKPSE